MQNGRERHRFTVIQDEPLFVGRFPGPADLSPFLDETTRRGVSRCPPALRPRRRRLTVTDVSLNGTWLFLRDGTRLHLRHATHAFTVGDRAQIQPSLEIIRSGRRYPSELPAGRLAARQRPGEPAVPPSGCATRPEPRAGGTGYRVGSLGTGLVMSPSGRQQLLRRRLRSLDRGPPGAASSAGDVPAGARGCLSSKFGRVTEPWMYAVQASSQDSGLCSNIRTALSSAGVGGGPVPFRICSMAAWLRSCPGVAAGCGYAALRNW